MYESKVEVNINSVNCLPQDLDYLISHHVLKRVQKIQCMEETIVLYVLPYQD